MRFTMDQVRYAIASGLARRGGGFATETPASLFPAPRPAAEFYVGNVPVDAAYVKSAIDAVGIEKFIELNPWANMYVQDTKKKPEAEEDAGEFSEGKPDYTYRDGLHDKLRSMFKFKKEHKIMWKKER